MKYLKTARFCFAIITVPALTGCFVAAGGSTDLDPGNPNGPQVGGQVQVDPRTGHISPGVSVGAGPLSIGLQL